MIVKCEVCEKGIDIGPGFSGMCLNCGHTAKIQWYLTGNVIDQRNFHQGDSLVFNEYKLTWKFGHCVAVRTRHCSRMPDTNKQRKRRVAKRRKHNHKTGRFPRG